MMLSNGIKMLTSDEIAELDAMIEEHIISMREISCHAELKLVDFTNDSITLWGNMHGTVMDPFPQDVVVRINREYMEIVN